MLNKDILRRLDAVEAHFRTCDQRDSRSLITEVELASQLQELKNILTSFVHKEETTMKDRDTKDFQAARDTSETLHEIKQDLQAIKVNLASQPKDTAILLAEHKLQIEEKNLQVFATKKDVTSGFNGLRSQAKLLWYIIAAGLLGGGWIVDKLIVLLPLIGK